MRSLSWFSGLLILAAVVIVGAILLLPSSSQYNKQAAGSGQAENAEKSISATSIPEEDILPPTRQPQKTEEQTLPNEPTVAIDSAPPEITPFPTAMSITSGTLAGIVKNVSGFPLKGATVEIPGISSTSSERDGKFKLIDVPVQSFDLNISLPGYYRVSKQGITLPHSPIEIILVEQGALAGRVQDQFGRPVAMAEVSAKALEKKWIKSYKTNSAGWFYEYNPPQDKIHVQAQMTGFEKSGQSEKIVDLQVPEQILLTLELETYSISGKVIEKDSHEAVSGFHITISRIQNTPDIPNTWQAASSPNGDYSIQDMPRGHYAVAGIASQNAESSWVIPQDQARRTITVAGHDVENVDIEVIRGIVVSGQVKTKDGQPVEGAQIGETLPGIESVQSDASGYYRTIAEPEVQIAAEHPTLGAGYSNPVPRQYQGEITGLDIILQGPGSVFGKVTDPLGNPIENAAAYLEDRARGHKWETVTNEEGIYSFDVVPVLAQDLSQHEGTHTLQISKEGYSMVQREIMVYSEEVNTIDVTLQPGGTIRGQVTDSSQKPVEGVRVTTYSPVGQAVTATTDINGVYTLESLPEGVYDILFYYKSSPPLTAALYRIEAGEGQAHATLSAGRAVVSGVIRNRQNGAPVTNCTLSIQGKPLGQTESRFVITKEMRSDDGRYLVELSESARYRFLCVAPNYRPASLVLTVATQEQTPYVHDFELEPQDKFGAITGILRLEPGISLARVEVVGVQSVPVYGEMFLVDKIPAGQHDLMFYLRDEERLFDHPAGILTSIEIKDNETTDLGELSINSLDSWYRPASQ